MMTNTNLEEKVEKSSFLGRFSPRKIYNGLCQRLAESNERLKEKYALKNEIAQDKLKELYNSNIEQESAMIKQLDYLNELKDKVEYMNNIRLAKEEQIYKKTKKIEEIQKNIYDKELKIRELAMQERDNRLQFHKQIKDMLQH